MGLHQIARYEVQKELGRGGMATVFLGYDGRFQRQVAIKMLPRELLHEPNLRARFEREAQIIAALEHPAIVPVYDFGEEDGQLFLVMRYLPGGSLEDKQKARLPLNWIAQKCKRIALAIDHAHSQNVIHRDLKPGNILFDTDDNAYLSDFGIAILSNASSSLTKGIIGTPAYMSPEQARGDTLTNASDLYSLGAVLFELVSGHPPYRGETPMGVAMRHITDPIPSVRAYRPELSAEFENFFLQAMAKQPRDRFSSAKELIQAFISLLPEEQHPPSSPAQPAVSSKVALSQSASPSSVAPAVDTPQAEQRIKQPKRQPPEATAQARPGTPKISQRWVWGLAFFIAGVVALFLFFKQGPRFTTNGSSVTDNETGLIWDASDNGADITFGDAAEYCDRGSRLPTTAELQGLYEGGIGIRSGAIRISACCVWASDPFTQRSLPAKHKDDDPGSWAFAFGFGNSQDGKVGWNLRSYSRDLRALCVRN